MSIKTIDIDQEFFEVFEEPFDWYEEPIVIEPERKDYNMAMLVKDILKKNIDDFLSTVYKEPKLKGSMIYHVK